MAIKKVLKSMAKKAMKAKPKAEKLYGALKKGASKAGKKVSSMSTKKKVGIGAAAGYVGASMMMKKKNKKSMRKR